MSEATIPNLEEATDIVLFGLGYSAVAAQDSRCSVSESDLRGDVRHALQVLLYESIAEDAWKYRDLQQ